MKQPLGAASRLVTAHHAAAFAERVFDSICGCHDLIGMMARRSSVPGSPPSAPKRFDSDSIPPTISLLLDKRLWEALHGSPEQLVREIDSLVPELKRQARWTSKHFEYFTGTEVPRSSLVIAASGSLNPLIPYGLCAQAACRGLAAQNMARTLGLYADHVLLPDIPTLRMLHWSNHAVDKIALLSYVLVLRVLEPMIRTGVIRFWRGGLGMCSSCRRALAPQVRAIAEELLAKADFRPVAKITGGTASVDLGPLYGQSIIYGGPLTRAQKARKKRGLAESIGREMYLEAAEQDIMGALLDLRFSSVAHASMFSTRRQALRALNAFDSDAPALNTVAAWESARSIELPWVRDLTVAQVLQLRNEADSALPSFRDSFVRRITTSESSPAEVSSSIAELRTEAAQIRAELDSARPHMERAFRGTFGFLGMSLAVYGTYAATQNPAIAAATGVGLLNALGYLHARGRDEHKARAKLLSSPAYVLVKAKELAEHAD